MSLRGHIVSTSFFAKCLRVDGWGHQCHLDTFLVFFFFGGGGGGLYFSEIVRLDISCESSA